MNEGNQNFRYVAVLFRNLTSKKIRYQDIIKIAYKNVYVKLSPFVVNGSR